MAEDESSFKTRTKVTKRIYFWLKIIRPYLPVILLWGFWFWITLGSGELFIVWSKTAVGAFYASYMFWWFWIGSGVLYIVVVSGYQIHVYSRQYIIKNLTRGTTIGMDKESFGKKATVHSVTYRCANIDGNSVLSRRGWNYVLFIEGCFEDDGQVIIWDGNYCGYAPYELPHEELRKLFYRERETETGIIREYTMPKCNDDSIIFFATVCYKPSEKKWVGAPVDHALTKDQQHYIEALRSECAELRAELKRKAQVFVLEKTVEPAPTSFSGRQ